MTNQYFLILFYKLLGIFSIYPSCVSSRVLGRTGSWAGPAWFKMLLGLGGNLGGGGGGKG